MENDGGVRWETPFFYVALRHVNHFGLDVRVNDPRLAARHIGHARVHSQHRANFHGCLEGNVVQRQEAGVLDGRMVRGRAGSKKKGSWFKNCATYRHPTLTPTLPANM